MALAESWHLRSRARECAATGEAFADGESIVTALFPDAESGGYLRKDFAVAAWQGRGDDGEKAFSFWKNVYHAPVTEEKPQMNRENPESLLRRLVEEDEDHTENVRYILAVMLERQKILRETDTQRLPTGILRIYEHRKEGDVFIIKDPNIPLSQVDQVQEEIIALLESGGKRPLVEEEAAARPELVETAVEELVDHEPIVSDEERDVMGDKDDRAAEEE